VETKRQVGGLNKYLKQAENELADLHTKVTRGEEALGRAEESLVRETTARSQGEQAYQSRAREFLSRFDAVKK
jgi:FtsZ-binding cell division protein ZapB